MEKYFAGRTWNGWRSTVLNNPCLVCLISVQSNFSSSILLRWLFPRRRIFKSVFNPKVWCGASRPEALQSKLKTAVHAPGKYRWEKNLVTISVHLLLRVLGTLANSVEFSEAWQCRFYFLIEICAIFNSARSGQGMVGSERCEVWWLCFLFSFQVWPIVQSFCDYQ